MTIQGLRHSLNFNDAFIGDAFVADNMTIAVLPADRDDRRLRLVMLAGGGPDGARLRLTDETFSEDVGWFAQGHIDLSPSQIRDLRAALGAPEPFGKLHAPRATLQRPQPSGSEQPQTVLLSFVRAG